MITQKTLEKSLQITRRKAQIFTFKTLDTTLITHHTPQNQRSPPQNTHHTWYTWEDAHPHHLFTETPINIHIYDRETQDTSWHTTSLALIASWYGMHITLETSYFTDYTLLLRRHTHTHTRHHTECLLWITLWLVLETSFNAPTTTLDSIIITQHCTHNTPPPSNHTMYLSMALLLYTSSITAPHLTNTQSLSATWCLSAYTITHITTLCINHT